MGEIVITYLMPILAVLGIGALLREVIKLNAERAARRETVSGDERENLREDVKFLRAEIALLRGDIDILKADINDMHVSLRNHKEEITERNKLYWEVANKLHTVEDHELRGFVDRVLAQLRPWVLQQNEGYND